MDRTERQRLRDEISRMLERLTEISNAAMALRADLTRLGERIEG